MSKLPYRQVHLDFHTSEKIEGIGSRFSRENFLAALKEGHLSSITVFSKCHHGWAYHPTKVNRQHPHLSFDLLGAQLEVCREAGVRAEVYISAGFDEKYAREHTDCLRTSWHGWHGSMVEPRYHRLCFGTPYLDQLAAEVDEVMQLYGDKVDGVFLDIVGIEPCYCQYCVAGMRELGMDPSKEENAREYAKIVYKKYTDTIYNVVAKYNPDMPIIHNDGGALFQGREIAFCNRGHFELESLPTGGWGYDHFPRAAAYARTLGREFLGMTGKFHKSWGEFGGYKHPNALRYEAALANACGAKCSVGDQLHPDGEFDLATYRCIGAAYKEIEAKEPWLTDAVSLADIGLLAAESCRMPYGEKSFKQDIGANRMMLEGHYLYNVIDAEEDFSRYKLLILPDNITLTGELKDKIDAYLKQGGKLLLTGLSGTDGNGSFALDLGLTFGGEGKFQPTYLRPSFDLYPNGITSYVMYFKNYEVALTDAFRGEVTAHRVDSYFNRTSEHFCSHLHTPYDRGTASVGAVVTDNVGYIAWDIFAEYAEMGAVHLRSMVLDTVDRLLGKDKTLRTTLPSCGVTSLFRQSANGVERLVHHLVYAVPKCRGNGVEVIEDLPTVYGTACTLRVDKKPARVYLAPEMKAIPFTYENGTLTYTVPSFTCSTLVVIE